MTNQKNEPQQQSRLLVLAQQCEQAGHSARAARFYKLAGEQAAVNYDNEQVLHCYNRALALMPDTAQAERFNVLLARERLLALLGDSAAQENDLASLESLAHWLNDDSSRAQVAARQAAWREATGDLAGAVTIASMATRLAQLVDLPAAEGLARAAWGRALTRQSHYKKAQSQLDQALDLAQHSNDRVLEADVERYRGILALDRSQLEAAREASNSALVLYCALRNRQGQIHIRNNLGHIHQMQGRLSEARRHWEEAQRLFLELGDAEGSLRTLVNLGASSSDVGQYEEARGYLEAAVIQARQINLPMGECFAHLNLGLVAHYQGRNQVAVEENRAAHQIAARMGSQRLQAHALAVLGHGLVGLEQFAAADEVYWEALAIWQTLELANMGAETQAGLARSALKQDNLELATRLVRAILDQAEVEPNFEGAELPARIYLTCYQILSQKGDSAAASALARGRQLVDEQCLGLVDESTRHSLRHNIPAHRALLAV